MNAAPLWRGRALAVLGIVLCAFSLRSAVASFSPLIDHVAAEFPLPAVVLGLIGAAPPACYAVFGLLTPLLERRLGLELLTVLALGATVLGTALRAVSGDALSLLGATMVIFAGVGVGNILLPPLVKTYLPDRIGTMMTVYSTVMAVATFLPPIFAVPVADAAGWRGSLSMWGVFSAAGVIPWIVLFWRGRRSSPAGGAAGEAPRGDARWTFRRLARLPLAWAIAVVLMTSAIFAYVSFAWLPTIMVDRAGVSAAAGGALLSLFSALALPCSLLVPVLVVRFQATRPLYWFGVLCGLAGVAGLLWAPEPSLLWLWVTLFGLTGALFPLALVLISVRAGTPESAVALSGFVQSVAYICTAAFPLLIGVLHDATGSWTLPLCVLAGVLIASMPAGLIAGRRRTIEEEAERAA